VLQENDIKIPEKDMEHGQDRLVFMPLTGKVIATRAPVRFKAKSLNRKLITIIIVCGDAKENCITSHIFLLGKSERIMYPLMFFYLVNQKES
jgi:hypothetical protein